MDLNKKNIRFKEEAGRMADEWNALQVILLVLMP